MVWCYYLSTRVYCLHNVIFITCVKLCNSTRQVQFVSNFSWRARHIKWQIKGDSTKCRCSRLLCFLKHRYYFFVFNILFPICESRINCCNAPQVFQIHIRIGIIIQTCAIAFKLPYSVNTCNNVFSYSPLTFTLALLSSSSVITSHYIRKAGRWRAEQF